MIIFKGNWFDKSGRGFIFGIWSANASVNIKFFAFAFTKSNQMNLF